MRSTTAIILAGGFGTRLREVVSHLPKPMATVRGKPFLDYHLASLSAQGYKKVILSTGHLAEKVSAHYGNKHTGLQIEYSVETHPLGTGGATREALRLCSDESVLVLNGDSLFDIDLEKFEAFHEGSLADCSIALRLVPDSSRYGSIEIDGQNNVLSFSEKSESKAPGLINAGVYLLNKKTFLQNIPSEENFSIEKDFFQKAAGKLRLKGFAFDAYFIDIGIPADYQRAQHEFKRFENR
jgi:D-glycero-alpha-D-manno-heptose 1-phosphate guanylyltransferase